MVQRRIQVRLALCRLCRLCCLAAAARLSASSSHSQFVPRSAACLQLPAWARLYHPAC